MLNLFWLFVHISKSIETLDMSGAQASGQEALLRQTHKEQQSPARASF